MGRCRRGPRRGPSPALVRRVTDGTRTRDLQGHNRKRTVRRVHSRPSRLARPVLPSEEGPPVRLVVPRWLPFGCHEAHCRRGPAGVLRPQDEVELVGGLASNHGRRKPGLGPLLGRPEPSCDDRHAAW